MEEEQIPAPIPDKDYAYFFFDPEFAKHPNVNLPAPTYVAHEGNIRPVKPGSFVVIHAVFKAGGKKLLQLSAEAVNSNEKLVATATSNWLVYEL